MRLQQLIRIQLKTGSNLLPPAVRGKAGNEGEGVIRRVTLEVVNFLSKFKKFKVLHFSPNSKEILLLQDYLNFILSPKPKHLSDGFLQLQKVITYFMKVLWNLGHFTKCMYCILTMNKIMQGRFPTFDP